MLYFCQQITANSEILRALETFPREKSFIVTLKNNDWLTDPAYVEWDEGRKGGNGMGEGGVLPRKFFFFFFFFKKEKKTNFSWLNFYILQGLDKKIEKKKKK